MGLKCRLLGHTYGEPEVERSREEQGDEVVVTVRELQVCERCGDEQVVSQNKEVTAIRSPAEVGLGESAADAADATAASGVTDSGSSAAVDPDAGAPAASATSAPNTQQRGNAERRSDAEQPSDAEPQSTPAVEATDSPSEGRVSDAGAGGVSERASAGGAPERSAAEPPESVENDVEEAIDWVDDPEAEASRPAPETSAESGSTPEPAADNPAPESAPESAPQSDVAAEGEAEVKSGTEGGVEVESAPGAAGDEWETGSGEWDGEPDPDVDDAVILDAEDTERDETQWPEEADPDPVQTAREPGEVTGPPPEDAHEQVTNDAEIIDADEGDSGVSDAGGRGDAERGRSEGAGPAGADSHGRDIGYERERSAWPEREDAPGESDVAGGESGGRSGGSDVGTWPDHDGDDEGFGAATDADADLEFGGNGLTPEVNGRGDAGNGTAGGVDGVAAAAPGDLRQREADESGGFIRNPDSDALESDVPDDRVEFYCPNCGHTQSAGSTSMRAGDICPECKQGYIAAREQ
ncbi:DUF7093 family protein [Halobellus sp. GM3]|uniref:DUF7093 family protein n=1 Tax=Halobellus sp. GM3 TaxID=3458410 RepID=UPI00403D96EE